MKVLHYSLGFPPYRSGGLTKFCVDLMVQQKKNGHEIALLWPGTMNYTKSEPFVKKRKKVRIYGSEINSFEIINPLPIAYDEGVKDIDLFVKKENSKNYAAFLENYNPDVIHIHTLMGLHYEFIQIAKNKKIRLVFTTHDFYPICPKVTLFHNGHICDSIRNCTECYNCNNSALSIGKIKILQSPLYRCLKDSYIIKKIRRKHRNEYFDSQESDVHIGCEERAYEYIKLRKYYESMLNLMDVIHYNSTITKKVYNSFFSFDNTCVLPISHSDIDDRRRKKNFDNQILRIRYLGPYSGAKGFFCLRTAIDQIWRENIKIQLDIHFSIDEKRPYIVEHDRYTYKDLGKIFDETDILVVPSIWYETYGFTVLEALSYGVPVIISDTVGAKDILADGAGIIVENIDSVNLADVIKTLTNQKLKEMNRVILEKQKIVTLEDVAKYIERECY